DLALRLKGDKSRPLLQNFNMVETLCALFEERDPIYNDIADHIIETKKKRLSDVSKEILEILK
ncbi:MAG: shikimate kinase, partial [Methylophilaceae bacterium]